MTLCLRLIKFCTGNKENKLRKLLERDNKGDAYVNKIENRNWK